MEFRCYGCFDARVNSIAQLCDVCLAKREQSDREIWAVLNGVETPHLTTKPNKYRRKVKGVEIDIYDVLRAWGVTCPAIQHAVKKLLAPGQRGHKDRITDLREALASVQRGIEMEEGK